MMNSRLLKIGKAANLLGISIDTLRRWDASGRLRAVRIDPAGHRYYRKEDIEILLKDLLNLAKKWAFSPEAFEPDADFYSSNSAVFQTRLIHLQHLFEKVPEFYRLFPLIVAITGEIGNNSFDHNLGLWPDLPGIFFAFDLNKRHIVLADRGQGILVTLQRIKPELHNYQQALHVAFTEIISGRAPEARGNGLKFVREVITGNPMKLFFQSGDAQLELRQGDSALVINTSDHFLRGCLAFIQF